MPHSSPIKPAVNARQFLGLSGALLLFCAASAGASATPSDEPKQQEPSQTTGSGRLVNAREGHAIAAVALAGEEPFQGAQDCSHLVHQIYSEAGYDYPYASSFDLYAGNGNFRRVRHAQAGDLVIWPGHVGIVVSPAHHTFYSLVRSGLQTEDYLGPYWRSRGRPRFYRYVIDAGPDVKTARLSRPVKPSGKSSVDKKKPATEVYAEAESETSKDAPEEASVRMKIPAVARVPHTDAIADAAPAIILLTSEQRRPTSEEALNAIAEVTRAAASSLRSEEPLRVKNMVVILEQFRVERVETKRNSGWLHLEIDTHVRIRDDGVDFKRRREKVRWELRRDASGWQAIAPTDRVYVGRDDAVRVLSAQLAELAQGDAAAKRDDEVLGQEARLANLLSALLQK